MQFDKVVHTAGGSALAKRLALCDTSPRLQYVVAGGGGNTPSQWAGSDPVHRQRCDRPIPRTKTYIDLPAGTGRGQQILHRVMGKRSFVLKSLGGVGGVCPKTTP